jgi:hypothetical protein
MIKINWQPSPYELRVFAIGQIVLTLLLATGLMKRGLSFNVSAGIVACSAAVGLAGAIRPSLIRWLYCTWMIAVFPIGWCLSQLLLISVFLFVVLPIGLLLRCVGIDPMSRRFEPTSATYWTKRRPMPPANRYFRPF